MATSLIYKTNGLYILLSDRGEQSYTFHWALYLHQSTNSGFIYDLINEANSTSWRFNQQTGQDARAFQRILVALKIGDLDPALHRSLLDRLKEIPIAYSTRFHESITCRVWLKEALFALDDEGYIMLAKSVNEIETEATTLAMQNKTLGKQTVSRSVGSQA
ncbi:hypothetical protein PENDEC_c008G02811 [Penicillium decumbens]|uniref:Uncharacterized protein n=1 Tax=Penicillium decumbens TaxID=69771 RepID=A0A1V6PDS6_PENDC|nr:hypothetical protein PENDEC_c008G02811 [Penicillium decumbens]